MNHKSNGEQSNKLQLSTILSLSVSVAQLIKMWAPQQMLRFAWCELFKI
jgi:hypothetical protein